MKNFKKEEVKVRVKVDEDDDIIRHDITDVQELNLPEQVEYLCLDGLMSAEGLKMDRVQVRWLELNGLTSAEKDKLQEKYPHIQGKIK